MEDDQKEREREAEKREKEGPLISPKGELYLFLAIWGLASGFLRDFFKELFGGWKERDNTLPPSVEEFKGGNVEVLRETVLKVRRLTETEGKETSVTFLAGMYPHLNRKLVEELYDKIIAIRDREE
jgi:hypothetical protein